MIGASSTISTFMLWERQNCLPEAILIILEDPTRRTREEPVFRVSLYLQRQVGVVAFHFSGMSNARLCFSLAAAATLCLPFTAQASQGTAGPCSERLQALGYRSVHVEAAHAHSSLYDGQRGRDEVKLMVQNGS